MVVVAAIGRPERSKRVVREAKSLADAFEDDLTAVHVMSRSEFRDLQQRNFDDSGEPIKMERIREFAAGRAREAAEDVAGDVEAVGLLGDASAEIVDYASERGARYVVVGGRKRSPTGKAVFGSVTQSVLLNADVPVLTVMRND
ncbi:universal stress protein [Halorarum salinum]|uniref:Universal stress protein n=1 Tax=Halorarum salinum TaxID=2743089 RepID=A0A7D5QBV3_9EURY|nr:universal stress protein [Halobaculum salinum]QLG61161.1 universal stress protein [Halobaculum salinum]